MTASVILSILPATAEVFSCVTTLGLLAHLSLAL